jgi:KDO2-lipid IV(A) lauroyltransferase
MYFAGWLTYSIARQTSLKKTIADNIKLVMPKKNAEQIADQLLKNVGYAIFELLCLPYFNKDHFKKIFRFEGLDNLQKIADKKKGVIILTLHAGNYEVIPAALADQGYKMTSILRATDDPIFKILNECRSQKGVRIINVSEQNMYTEAIRVLSDNGIIGTLADTGALEGRHVFMKFLGWDVPAATGWLTLAQRSGAMVVPTLTRKQGRKNIITLHEPFIVTKDNRDEMMQKVKTILEDFVRENPDQWGLFLNSYETQRMVKGE